MGARPDGDAGTALSEALRLDATLVAEPARLRRALADLAPHDERGWLLALGAAVTVPELINQGQAAEAAARLADVCGCRPESVGWVLSAWALALGRELPDPPSRPSGTTPLWSDGTPEPERTPVEGTQAEEPGAPSALRVCVWPDGTPAAAMVTMRGVFVLADLRGPARGRWRRAATPRTPLARDVALVVDGHQAEVVWTDHDGVHARSLRRSAAGPLGLGGPRLLDTPPDGEQARYPLAALGGEDTLWAVWTADRRAIVLTEERSWQPGGKTVPLPAARTEGERLASLDACAETERTAWLACRTDRGRILAAQWDLAITGLGRWLPLDPPVAPVSAAIMCLAGVPVLVAATVGGELLSLDVKTAANGAADWHSIDRPRPVREAAPARIVTAGATGQRPGAVGNSGWLALAGQAGICAMPVTRSGDIVECGDPIDVWTGE